jgi:hypothetical protein
VIDSVVAGLRSETGAMANARIVPIEKLIEKQHNLSADDVRGIVDAAISAEREKQRHDRDQAIAAAVEEARRADKADIADLEQRLRDTAGEAPQVRTWSPSTVFYRGQYVTHAGALYQARRDVASTPMSGSDDWLCVARAGRDGKDGRSIVFRGAYDMRDLYSALDVVAYEGQSFVPVRDNPAGIPGDSADWLVIAARGVKGERGEPGKVGQRGHKGDRGKAGAKIEEWRINRENFVVVPFYDDGTSGPPLRRRDLFQEFINQTG